MKHYVPQEGAPDYVPSHRVGTLPAFTHQRPGVYLVSSSRHHPRFHRPVPSGGANGSKTLHPFEEAAEEHTSTRRASCCCHWNVPVDAFGKSFST